MEEEDDADDEDERRSRFDKAVKFLERHDITYPSAITDRDDVYAAYFVRSLPSTLLIDDQGRIVDYSLGVESARELVQRAAAMLPDDGASG